MVRRFSASPLAYVAFLVSAALLLSSSVAIAGRAMQMYRIKQDELRLQRDVNELAARNTALRTQRDFYSSDRYIEQVAREELGLVKPGEIPVIVVQRRWTDDGQTTMGLQGS